MSDFLDQRIANDAESSWNSYIEAIGLQNAPGIMKQIFTQLIMTSAYKSVISTYEERERNYFLLGECDCGEDQCHEGDGPCPREENPVDEALRKIDENTNWNEKPE